MNKYDILQKINQENQIRTKSGASISIFTLGIIAILTLSELWEGHSMKVDHSMSVDTKRNQMLDVHFNITFPHVPCFLLSLDVLDNTGDHSEAVSENVEKTRLDESGKVIRVTKASIKDNKDCGSCYGAESKKHQCCNTCDDLKSAYSTKGWNVLDIMASKQCANENMEELVKTQSFEGCNMAGEFSIHKIQGNFHFAAGQSFQMGGAHVHALLPYSKRDYDFTHNIHYLSFGPRVSPSPLDGSTMTHPRTHASTSTNFKYFIKVISTEYQFLNFTSLNTNQFSVTHHYRDVGAGNGQSMGLPGVFFDFDISPIQIKYREYKSSWIEMLINICAIVGGVFTVAGLIDGAVFYTERKLKEKAGYGKLS
eukprot:NODE_774_length_4360_cov_0.289134.p1 type:complete len:367 gc:universal NODE_774_length_4360_cov_0.289134:3187-2087(-)